MPKNEKKTIGENIKDIRVNKRHMKQRELAEKLHITPSLLAQYESNKRTPKYYRLQEIAKCLDVRPEDLDEDLKPLAFDSPAAYENAYTQIAGVAHPDAPSIETQLKIIFPFHSDEGITKIKEYADDLLGNVKYRRDEDGIN